jgi:hypothetical protein
MEFLIQLAKDFNNMTLQKAELLRCRGVEGSSQNKRSPHISGVQVEQQLH